MELKCQRLSHTDSLLVRSAGAKLGQAIDKAADNKGKVNNKEN